MAALVQHQKWYSSRTMIMGLFCALTAVMMVQTHFANNQRQVSLQSLAVIEQVLAHKVQSFLIYSGMRIGSIRTATVSSSA